MNKVDDYMFGFLLFFACLMMTISCTLGELLSKPTPTSTPTPTSLPTLTPTHSPTATITPTFTPTFTATSTPQTISSDNVSSLINYSEWEIPGSPVIWDIQWNENGKILAVLTEDLILHFYDIDNRETIKTMALSDDALNGFSLSPDFSMLAIHKDKAVSIIEVPSGKPIQDIILREGLSYVAFSPDNRFVALAMTYGLYLWSIENQSVDLILDEGENYWKYVYISSDGSFLISASCIREGEYGCVNYSISKWDIATQKATLNFPLIAETYTRLKIAVSGDENVIAVYETWNDRTAQVFDLRSGDLVGEISYTNEVPSLSRVTLDHNGGLICLTEVYEDSFSGEAIYRERLVDINTNNVLLEIENSGGLYFEQFGWDWNIALYYGTMAFNKAGNILVTGAQDGKIRLWAVIDR